MLYNPKQDKIFSVKIVENITIVRGQIFIWAIYSYR